MSKIKLLSTKKHSESESSLLSDFDLIDEDFIKIELSKFDVDITKETDLLLFTSKNAVLSALENTDVSLLKQINCICVGEKTKELLEENGFNVLDFTHYAEDLTKVISQKYSHNNFIFFCGNLRRNTLPDFFKKNKMFHVKQK